MSLKVDEVFLNNISDSIAEHGWVVVDHIFPDIFMDEMISEANQYWEEGEFRKAGVGVGDALQVRPEIRSDRVFWLDEHQLTKTQQQYWDVIAQIRSELNQQFFLNAKSFEAHFAVYPPGSFYKKHLDQFKEVRHRVITCLLYLNEDWKPEHGGQLRVYDAENPEIFTDVLPEKGRFVCFRSDTIYHEVLPANRERFSLTGWIRTG